MQMLFNIKSRFTALLFSLLMILISSCETVVKMDLPPHDPQLVINGLIIPGDTISINLTKSVHILDDSELHSVENALVLLYVNGILSDTLKHSSNGNYLSEKVIPAAGNTYTISASANGFETAGASTAIPAPVSINLVSIADSAVITPESVETLINFNVSDPGTSKNYYMIQLIAVLDSNFIDTLGMYYCNGEGPVFIYSDDPVFDENNQWGNNTLSLSDDLFNGKIKQLPLKLNSYDFNCGQIKELHLVFHNLTKDYYLYTKTLSAQQQTSGNPFSEPVPVYNNITNGFGILGSYSEFSLQIK